MPLTLPEEFVREMRAIWGDAFPAFVAALEREPVAGLRVNPLKPSRAVDAYVAAFAPVAHEKDGFVVPRGERPGKRAFHAAGLYYMQEPSAMLPARLLDVQPGERVLDLCAAPGGKSTQLAAAMRGEGLLVANEIHPQRARVLLENLERLGVTNAVVLSESAERLSACLEEAFDAILVDAPCSGEGMFRREGEAVAQWSPQNVKLCHERQVAILGEAAKMLRPGGRLVYSTCTYNRTENEGTLEAFLAAHPAFTLAAQPVRLAPHLLAGEGQFAALLRKGGDAPVRELPLLQRDARPDPRWTSFAQEALCEGFAPALYTHTDWLYALPPLCPDVKGMRLNVLRVGLQLGRLEKGRFEPAHALALAGLEHRLTRHIELDEARAAQYLHGETLALDGGFSGWGTVDYGGWPLGLVKGSEGQLKNKLPKGMRL